MSQGLASMDLYPPIRRMSNRWDFTHEISHKRHPG